MNKYYIAWPVPETLRAALVHAQSLVSDWLLPGTKRTPEEELHITALYLGEYSTQDAENLMNVFHGNTAIDIELLETTAFYTHRGNPNALIVRIKDLGYQLRSAHDMLVGSSGKTPDFPFNPHITLAKCGKCVDVGLPKAADVLNMNYSFKGVRVQLTQAALYEKAPGGSYAVHRLVDSVRSE